jgi:TRAP-type C4-dicarboxylate transport system substrate-binding protein
MLGSSRVFFAAAAAVLALSLPAQADNVTIRASIQSPAASHLSKGFDWLLNEIETATKGRVKFERYYSGSIAKPNEQLRAASTGLAGISLVVPNYIPAQLPLANVGGNPALWKDSWVGSKAYSALYQKVPAMQAELDKQGVQLISAIATPTYFLMGRKVDLSNVKQLNGMRVMTSGQIAVLLKSLGAQIVNVSTPEGYEALQRGTVDGAVYGLTSATTYGIEGVVQSLWHLPLGGLPMVIVMNKRIWNSISKEDQAAIMQVAAKHPEGFHKVYQIDGDEESLKAFKKANVKIIEPDEESLKALRAAAEKIWAQWAAEQDAAGRPGKQVMDEFVRLTDDFAKNNPYAAK